MAAPGHLTAPRPPVQEPGELHHTTCCDDDTGMCGEDLKGQRWCDPKTCTCIPCPLCALVIKDGLPCTVPGCDP